MSSSLALVHHHHDSESKGDLFLRATQQASILPALCGFRVLSIVLSLSTGPVDLFVEYDNALYSC